MYCAPAWTGICSAADRLRLDRFLNCCKRIGFCATDLPSVTELHSDADNALFETIMTNSCAHTAAISEEEEEEEEEEDIFFGSNDNNSTQKK